MKHWAFAVVVLITLPIARASNVDQVTSYRAVLESPGGELPFRLDMIRDDGGTAWRAVIHNGSERIELSDVTVRDDQLSIRFEHYGSWIEAKTTDDGKTWRGEWIKVGRDGKQSSLEFAAEPYQDYRFRPLAKATSAPPELKKTPGKWKVTFSQSDEPAIGVFRLNDDRSIEGTFLTTGGDYRFLAGTGEIDPETNKLRMRLSAFDGSHAFLFDATLQADGTLKGDFWSRDTWHETWTAARAPDGASLPDGFAMSHATARAEMAALRFPRVDLSDKNANNSKTPELSLAEVCGNAKVCVLEIFGSWCPNCHDASRFLSELQTEYGPRGLRVVGLTFEYTGDLRHDAIPVRKFAERNHATYPILYGGLADREMVARALPFVDKIRAYPTTVILSSDGTVRAIHTGFSGPATGEAYDELRTAFKKIIEEALVSE